MKHIIRKTKYIFLLILLAIAAHEVDAQVPVVVLEYSWRFEVRNPAMGQDPLRDAKLQEERGLAQTRSVTNPNPHRPAIFTEVPSGQTAKGSSSAVYVYRIKVRNVGKRSVKGLELDYVFADKITKKELGRLKLSSASQIAAGKSRTLTFRSVSPPIGTVQAGTSESKDLYLESVVIQGVRYQQN